MAAAMASSAAQGATDAHQVTRLDSADQALAWLRSRSGCGAQSALRTDSRQVLPGDVFLAWPGAVHDGRTHVTAALAAGAAACLVEADGLAAAVAGWDSARVAAMPHLKAAAGGIAHQWSGRPSEQMQVLAITGTNGKTSTSWWLSQALTALGQPCGVLGTLGVGAAPAVASSGSLALLATGLTTPDAVTLHASLRQMQDAGNTACAMEASSIGIEEHRLGALHIAVALFTNLTQDHLDYHHTMAAYWAAKRRLFSWPGLRAAVVNVDDAYGLNLAQELSAKAPSAGPEVWTVSLGEHAARLQAQQLQQLPWGLVFDVLEYAADGKEVRARATVRSTFVGRYNASNLMVVLGGLRASGVSLQAAAAALAQLRAVPGRLQRVATSAELNSDLEVLVDYAHTPDALDKVLQAVAPLAQARRGQVWCVVGCGGDRDATKRPLMAQAAARGARRLVLTSDNPRSEDPAHILQQMMAGLANDAAAMQSTVVIEDRRAAIEHAVLAASAGDVLVLAGKGHEQTQEVRGVKLPFCDATVAQQALSMRARGGRQHTEAAAC